MQVRVFSSFSLCELCYLVSFACVRGRGGGGGVPPFHLSCDIIGMQLFMLSSCDSLQICRLNNDVTFIAAIGNLCLLFCFINPARDCSVLLIFPKYWLLVSLIFPFLSFSVPLILTFIFIFFILGSFFVVLFLLA